MGVLGFPPLKADDLLPMARPPALRVIPDRQGTASDIDCLKEAFALFDCDRDGEISVEELGKVMRTHGFDPTEEDLKDMIRNVDTNANGAIDFNEFIEMMVKGRGHSVEDDVVHAFKVFDRDGDGLISEEELRLTMTNLGEALTEAEVRHMIAEADMGDGKINFAEFSRLMAHNSGPGGGAGANSGQSKGV